MGIIIAVCSYKGNSYSAVDMSQPLDQYWIGLSRVSVLLTYLTYVLSLIVLSIFSSVLCCR